MKLKLPRILTGALILAMLTASPGFAREEPLRIVTTTTDLAYIAAQIGGDRVETKALLDGRDDPHYAQARPDFIVQLNRADVFVEVGLELEVGWSPLLVQASRNSKVLGGGPGYCDASLGVRVLGRPRGQISRAMGDVHSQGNPHYWTDPLNAAIVGRNIRDALIRVNPAGRRVYDANYRAFHERMKRLTIREAKKFAPYRGMRVAVYHQEFAYLAERFGFEVITSLEEKPGVPPSAAYLKEMVDLLQVEEVKIILTAPFNDQSYARSVAEQVGGVVIEMPLSVASEPGIDTYEKTIESMLERLREAQDARK
ncbi:MAG: metal ABC transporter substrate-binding protein [Leptospirales bacterium]|jgi:zinc/manganese transport system substrate-binding protein